MPDVLGRFQRAVGVCDLRLRAARALVLGIFAEAWTTLCAGEIPPPRFGLPKVCVQAVDDSPSNRFRYVNAFHELAKTI